MVQGLIEKQNAYYLRSEMGRFAIVKHTYIIQMGTINLLEASQTNYIFCCFDDVFIFTYNVLLLAET